jgi:hypothetical protein
MRLPTGSPSSCQPWAASLSPRAGSPTTSNCFTCDTGPALLPHMRKYG